MTQQYDVSMPEDWNDHAGWDRYYDARLAKDGADSLDEDTGSISVGQLPGLAEEMTSKGWSSVWVPGCGLSPLAHLMAHVGLDVTATDVSRVAVEFQRQAASKFEQLRRHLGPASATGSLVADVHDFRQEFRPEAFDLIINVKAFQGFSRGEMPSIARVHSSALRPGRTACFDTLNVQGELRDRLEGALESGGFVVPYASVNRWYRAALRETGIPHVFVLGRPLVPRTDEYEDGGPDWDRDMARLREISEQYNSRIADVQDAEDARIAAGKVASVIYSTG